ncbi:MAG: PD-(D/E)XK nuclease family protein [Acidimicrobiales bacterium]
MAGSSQLNPAQNQVLEMLGAKPDKRPEFDTTLRVELKAELEAAIGHLASALPADEILYVGKHHLAQVMGCETKYLAELEEEFEWSIPLARGTLSHKAIELSVHWRGEPSPLSLVDEVLAKAEFGDDNLARWLQGIDEAERAELRGDVNNRVTSFMECWPPLKREWRPATETAIRVELAQSQIILAGKVDLALGRASGQTAGKVIVDLKTGQFSPNHRDDLRYYALLDAIRVGIPPRLIATYYLDQGQFTPESVTVALLQSTVERVIDAVHRIVEIKYAGVEPNRQPGPGCRWCPVLTQCEPGTAFLNDAADDF